MYSSSSAETRTQPSVLFNSVGHLFASHLDLGLPSLSFFLLPSSPASLALPSSDGYTEYIEVGFSQAVYPKRITIGQNLGAGAVVRIRVRAQDGSWQQVYAGDPQPDVDNLVSAAT